MQPKQLFRRPLLPGLAAVGASALALACLVPGGVSAAAKPKAHRHAKVNLAALARNVKEAAAQPSFTTYAKGYGAPVKDVAKLKGEKLMIVPGDSQLAACTEIAQAVQVLAQAVGMKTTIFSTTGLTSQLLTAVGDAEHEGYNAIDFECDFNPVTIAPAIAQAEAKGLKVVTYGSTPQEVAKSHVQGNTVDPFAFDAKIAVEQAVVQHHGKPFHAIGFLSKVNPLFEPALEGALHQYCPKCTLTNVFVPVTQWFSGQLQTSVTSALLKNPSATVLFPHYAGMLAPMVAGIEAAHRQGTVKSYLAFGGGTPEMQQQATGVGHAIIQSDIGGYPVWTGYLLFVNTAKVLVGQTPIAAKTGYGPDRVATPQNVAEILRTGGWGTNFVNGFRGMLGLKPLSGKALAEASTLNGAMTAKP